jgi:hypothetical protein
MADVPDPADIVSHEAASDVRSLILAHVHATDFGVDALFLSSLDAVVGRSLAEIDQESTSEGSGEYLAGVLSAFAYIVRSLAVQAAPLDPEGNLRRLMAEFDERDTTF